MDFSRHALIVALVVASSGCRRPHNEIAPDPSGKRSPVDATPNDEAEVWSTVVDAFVAPFVDAGEQRVALVSKTIAPNCETDLSSSIPTAERDLIAAFGKLVPDARVDGVHTAVPLTMIDADAAPPGASIGVVEISSVAFDDGRREALVYLEHWRDGRFGVGYVVHLVRDGARWRHAEMVRCWIS